MTPEFDPTDETLVRQTLAGDRTAFDALVRRHQGQAMGVAQRLLGNKSDAAEVVQDSLFKAYKSLASLQQPAAFAGWLMRIVNNLSLNKRRGRSLRKTTAIESDDGDHAGDFSGTTGLSGQSLQQGDSDPFRSLIGKELGARLEVALAGLPEKQRLAIVMFTVQQLPQKEVAQALDCSVEAVKWHVFQGRKKLKEILKEYL